MIIRLAQPVVQGSSLFGQRLVSVFGQETCVQGSSSFSVMCQELVSKEDVINDPSPSLVEASIYLAFGSLFYNFICHLELSSTPWFTGYADEMICCKST